MLGEMGESYRYQKCSVGTRKGVVKSVPSISTADTPVPLTREFRLAARSDISRGSLPRTDC